MTTHPDRAALRDLTLSLKLPQPIARLLWTAAVDIAGREDLGDGGNGPRFIVPILGGQFWGGPGFEGLCGQVRAGGADRQWLRPDGVKQLEAIYEMQTDDGAVLGIRNHVIVDESAQPERYAMSHLAVTAPAGPHAWLNRRALVGTLQTLRPARQAVVVRAWLLES